MLAFAVGDIVGSRFEFNNHKTDDPYDFDLFDPKCKNTDDTVMSLAVCQTLLRGDGDYEWDFVELAQRYPSKGYGGHFARWVENPDRKPYHSWGNGAGMRVSPVAWWFDNLADVRAEARRTADPTHNHPEGYKGAEAIASSVFMARIGHTPGEIRKYVEDEFGYDLNRTTDQIRPGYRFEVSCQKSVPEAIICALESKDFEHGVRLCVSLGGDCDTTAAMAAPICSALHGGVPTNIMEEALKFIEPELIVLAAQFIEAAKSRRQPKQI